MLAAILMTVTPVPAIESQLADPAREAAAVEVMHGLRCVQCQGQSVADSDAPIAVAMRAEVRRRIDAGESKDAVKQWMIGRYGEWVSFEPATHGAGLLLWIAPIAIFAIALLVAAGMFRKRKG